MTSSIQRGSTQQQHQ